MILQNSVLVGEIVLVTVIVDFGKGSQVLRISRHNGITGGTVILADGTVQNGLLNFLGISDVRKEMVLMAGERSIVEQTIKSLDNELDFSKPNHGIALLTPLCRVTGTASINCNLDESSGEGDCMYEVINIIVDKGKAEEVIDAATSAGSKGGTIINARGAGVHETRKVFAMEIEPEKEIVMIVAKNELVEPIINSISEKLELNKPGNGIIYVQKALKTYGLYE